MLPLPPKVERYFHPSSLTSSGNWRLDIPIYIYAVVFASLCVVWGLTWDIMWHISIGRDGLFAPPHILIYTGAMISGLFSAYQILQLTFLKQHPGRVNAVPFWGVFYGSLGAMFSVWGALAMLTSAPLDDWWHNTYGLDVHILTPPHVILIVGIMTVQFGAMIGVLALQNQLRQWPIKPTVDTQRRTVRLTWLLAVAASLLLAMLCLLVSGPMAEDKSHQASYYVVGAIIFPVYLLAVSRAAQLRWPLTTIAGLYLVAAGLPNWIIQFFPATPRLGPVLNPITHYQPFHFPLLLVGPALAVDWLMHQTEKPTRHSLLQNGWVRSGLYASLFMLVLLAVQWPFGAFLQTSPLAQNYIFLSYSCSYDSSPDAPYRHTFAPWHLQSAGDFWLGFGKALLYATLSARVGLFWGNWMRRVVR